MKKLLLIICSLLLVLLPACSASDRWDEAIYLTELDSDNITLGGAPLLIPAYAELYISTSIAKALTVANTDYLISGNTTSEELKGFTSNGLGRLTYTDITPDRICLITAAISFTARPVATYTFKLYRSGILDLASKASDALTTADSIDNIAMVSLLTLQPNDYVEVYVSSNTSSSVIQFLTMSLSATTVD